MTELSDEELAEIITGCEGVTPGPWRCCGDHCKCTSINAGDHPVASVTKGEWGDEYPSLRFKEGGEGTIQPSAVEAYIAMIAYGDVPVDEAMRNRAHIARLSPERVLSMATELQSLRAKVDAYEAGQRTSYGTTIPLPQSKPEVG